MTYPMREREKKQSSALDSEQTHQYIMATHCLFDPYVKMILPTPDETFFLLFLIAVRQAKTNQVQFTCNVI